MLWDEPLYISDSTIMYAYPYLVEADCMVRDGTLVIDPGVEYIGKFAFGNCNSLTIYCEATTKPNGWSSDWNIDLNRSNCPVVWNYNE
mgnify:CR=1 FL=1